MRLQCANLLGAALLKSGPNPFVFLTFAKGLNAASGIKEYVVN